MMDKEIIRQNLSSLSGEKKIEFWNRFVEAQIVALHDNGLEQYVILHNIPRNIDELSWVTTENVVDVMFKDCYNREDEYITAEEGFIHSLKKNDAFALADVNLRIDFVDAYAKNIVSAVRLYEEYFPTKTEKPAEEHKDSEEYKSDKNYFKCVYTNKDGKPSVEVETTDHNGEVIKREYRGKDAEDAWKAVKDKMERDSKSDRLFGEFLNSFDNYFNDRFFGDFKKGFLPW